MSRSSCLALMITLLGCGAIGCGGSEASGDGDGPGDGDAPDAGEPAPSYPYPVPDWPTGEPSSHGLDEVALEEAAAAAERLNSYCLLVIRDGVLVFERYFNGTDASSANESWSIAKSYSSTLVGIAIARGDIGSLDDSVATYVPAWVGTEKEAITIRDLVSMTSGLEWSAFKDYGQMALLSSDHTSFALGLDLENEPGTEWVYHNGGVQILEPVIQNATGLTIEAYAEQHLWSKIGSSATWAHDRSDNPTAYANVMASCRDHARFGYLYLRRGRWAEGESVLPESWVSGALTPSQDFNRAYGRLFWLNGYEPTKNAMMEDKPGILVPYAPEDLFAARGFGNQFIDVIPSLDMIVVRFGVDPTASFDIQALITDARFNEHDEILSPVLNAVR